MSGWKAVHSNQKPSSKGRRVSIAPGDKDYHGGQWKFFSISFNAGVTPYLLTSAQAILDAESAGDVTITRVAEMDFRCPIQK